VTLAERRRAPRLRQVEEHGIVSARIRPGTDARVIDLAPGGALLETVHRLLPGAPVELQLTRGESRIAVRGRVGRAAIARLGAGGVAYRGAVIFDEPLPALILMADGYPIPASDARR
jgi:hypothetical protein